MSTNVYPTSREKIISSAFTVGIHTLFIMFLIFGLTWQRQYHPEANSVDLWASLPSSQPFPPVPPVVKLEPVEPLPPTLQPQIAKPDIALKDKTEREQHSVDEKRKEEDKKRQQEMTAQRLAQEQEEARQNVATQQAAARQTEIDKYKKEISDRIRRFIIAPPNLQSNPELEAEFVVRVLPGGEVLAAPLKKSSGMPAYDDAVERAIFKAQPLPLPSPESPIFNEFRELSLTFKPQE
jgi:colicin import membrane protein